MEKRGIFNIFLFFSMGFLMISVFSFDLVLGTGISPATGDIEFEPFVNKSLTYKAINNRNQDSFFRAYVAGDLREHISCPEEPFLVDSNSRKSFICNVSFPEKFLPGRYEARIGVSELEPEDNGQGFFQIVTAVESKLFIYVSDDFIGDFIPFEIEDLNIESKDTNNFLISFNIMNLLNQELKDVDLKLKIISKKDTKEEIVDEISFGSFDFHSNEKKEIRLDYSGSLDENLDSARFIITYKDKVYSIEESLSISRIMTNLILLMVFFLIVTAVFLYNKKVKQNFRKNKTKKIQKNSKKKNKN
jgi:hypothetical protein